MVDTNTALLDYYIERLARNLEDGNLSPEQVDRLRALTEDPNWLCKQYNTSGWAMRYPVIAPFFLWLHEKRCPDLNQPFGISEQFEDEDDQWTSVPFINPDFVSKAASEERLQELERGLNDSK